MFFSDDFKFGEDAPLLLRRIEKKPRIQIEDFDENDPGVIPIASHMTVVTTAGMQPEMHDQDEDASR